MSAEFNSLLRRRWLQWRAMWRLAAASAGLRVSSFRRMQRWIGAKTGTNSEQAEGRVPRSAATGRKYSAEELAGAVQSSSRFVPGSTCLVQALAGQWLLRREGYAPELRVGVSKAEGFEAHAWLEVDGKVLVGESEVGRFTPLEPIEDVKEVKS